MATYTITPARPFEVEVDPATESATKAFLAVHVSSDALPDEPPAYREHWLTEEELAAYLVEVSKQDPAGADPEFGKKAAAAYIANVAAERAREWGPAWAAQVAAERARVQREVPIDEMIRLYGAESTSITV